MVAAQLELDLTRPERSAENIERSLRALSVGTVQRAVLLQLCLDPRCQPDSRGLRSLTISQSRAAAWIAKHVPCVAGTCHDTSVRKAWQFWADQGVLIVTSDRNGHTIKWHPQRIMDWHQMRLQQIEDSLPIFKPIGGGPSMEEFVGNSGGDCSRPVVTGGDCSRPVVTGGDCSRPVVTGGDPLKKREEEDEEDLLHPPQRQVTPPAVVHELVSADVARLVYELPELPAAAWDSSRSDSGLYTTINAWWSEHMLSEKCGEHTAEVVAALIGLLMNSRGKVSPEAYFSSCLQRGIQTRNVIRGRTWLSKMKRQREGTAVTR